MHFQHNLLLFKQFNELSWVVELWTIWIKLNFHISRFNQFYELFCEFERDLATSTSIGTWFVLSNFPHLAWAGRSNSTKIHPLILFSLLSLQTDKEFYQGEQKNSPREVLFNWVKTLYYSFMKFSSVNFELWCIHLHKWT